MNFIKEYYDEYFGDGVKFISELNLYFEYVDKKRTLYKKGIYIHDIILKLIIINKLIDIINKEYKNINKENYEYIKDYYYKSYIIEFWKSKYDFYLDCYKKNYFEEYWDKYKMFFKDYETRTKYPRYVLNLTEGKVLRILKYNLDKYKKHILIPQKRLDVKYKSNLIADFWIDLDYDDKSKRVVVEYDGLGHHPGTLYYNNNSKLRDDLKNEYCIKNNISIIRFNDINFLKSKINSILSGIYKSKKVYFINQVLDIWNESKKDNNVILLEP